MIDCRDFLAAKRRAETEVHVAARTEDRPDGWSRLQRPSPDLGPLDKVRAKHPDMVLIHGGSPKGAELIAAKWATTARCRRSLSSRTGPGTPRQHRSSATTRCSNVLPIGVMHFPGTGIQDNLADKAKRARHCRLEVRRRVSAVLPTFRNQVELHAPQLRQVSTLCPKLRRGGGGRRDRSLYENGATTMLALGLVLNTVGLGLFCWLIFALAVYAVPFFVAVTHRHVDVS